MLPSERHKDICFLTNDGFEGTNGGTKTVTDNDGNEIIVGNWWERACEGLSVFWLANIQNFVHDNAAVGGFAGIWVFTHNSYKNYGWQAIPKDPITGKREWRNNKASASFQGQGCPNQTLSMVAHPMRIRKLMEPILLRSRHPCSRFHHG